MDGADMVSRIPHLGLALALWGAVLAPALCGRAEAANTASVSYRFEGGRLQSVRTVTRATVQAVLDRASPRKHLYLQFGRGNLDLDSTLWVHGNTTIAGPGQGATTLTRSRFNAADPTNHGHVVASAPYGRHQDNSATRGGIPTDSLAGIHLSGFTVDGGARRWPAVNPNKAGNFGIQLWFVEGATIQNVEVRNTLQTGIELDACRDSRIADCYVHDVGLERMLGTRNGINLNNNSPALATTVRWARRLSIKKTRIVNHIDAGINCSNVSDVDISGIEMSCNHDSLYGNMAFEFEGSVAGYTMRNFTISDVKATGHTGRLFQKGGSIPLDGLKISNCTFTASRASNRGAIVLASGSGARAPVCSNVDISDCTFKNLNASNSDGSSTTATFFWLYAKGGPIAKHVRVSRCRFEGGAGGTAHKINRGFLVGGNLEDFQAVGCVVKNAEDIGFEVVASGSDVARELLFQDCFVDGAQAEGYKIFQNGVTGSVIGCRFINNTAKDTNKGGPGWAFQLDAQSGVVKSVRFEGCRVIRSAGKNMSGLRLSQGGSGKADSVWVGRNELSAGVVPFQTVGRVTNQVTAAASR
jgi:hypothetical protein